MSSNTCILQPPTLAVPAPMQAKLSGAHNILLHKERISLKSYLFCFGVSAYVLSAVYTSRLW